MTTVVAGAKKINFRENMPKYYRLWQWDRPKHSLQNYYYLLPQSVLPVITDWNAEKRTNAFLLTLGNARFKQLNVNIGQKTVFLGTHRMTKMALQIHLDEGLAALGFLRGMP